MSFPLNPAQAEAVRHAELAAEMRQTLGTAVFSGMLGVTLFGIFLTPVFYYVIQWFADRRERKRAALAALRGEEPGVAPADGT